MRSLISSQPSLLYVPMSRTPHSASSSYRSSILVTAHSRMAAALLISVTTGHIRCGMFLNIDISTIFGSTSTSLSSSGRLVKRKDMMIEFMQTDLPEPVVPAMSMCGILLRSSTTGLPDASLPRYMGRFISVAASGTARISSATRTISRLMLGTSIPTVSLPAMFGTMRMFCAFIARARSVLTPLRRETFVPGARRISKRVMTGPESMPTTSPWMLYCCIADSSLTA